MTGAEDTTRTGEDAVKRQFREALERKQAGRQKGEAHTDGDSKVHEAHGPASSQRTFRRKAGG